MDMPKLEIASGFRQKVTCALLDCRSDEQQLKVALELLHESNDIIDCLRGAEVIRRCEAHDGLVEKLSQIRTCLLVLKNTKTEEGIRDLPEQLKILYKVAEQALEGEPNDPVLAAAKKCAKTGDHKDLQEYLKERRNER